MRSVNHESNARIAEETFPVNRCRHKFLKGSYFQQQYRNPADSTSISSKPITPWNQDAYSTVASRELLLRGTRGIQ